MSSGYPPMFDKAKYTKVFLITLMNDFFFRVYIIIQLTIIFSLLKHVIRSLDLGLVLSNSKKHTCQHCLISELFIFFQYGNWN